MMEILSLVYVTCINSLEIEISQSHFRLILLISIKDVTCWQFLSIVSFKISLSQFIVRILYVFAHLAIDSFLYPAKYRLKVYSVLIEVIMSLILFHTQP